MPQLLGEHELRVRRDTEQGLPEHERAVLRRRDHLAPPEQLDEVPEQALVEELGRIESVQNRHALRHQMAALLERFVGDAPRTRPQQHCNHEVIALQRQSRKLEEDDAKLEALRRRLQAGEDSPELESFDGDHFIAAMHEKYSK